MTAFDAPKYLPAEHSTALGGAAAALRIHFGALLAAIVAISILLAAIAALILGLHVLSELFASSVGRTQISVLLNPAVSRAEVERVGGLIKARPDVLDATLRDKDHASDGLQRGAGFQLADGQLQLPDVWLVTLRPERANGRTTATAAHFAAAKSYFGSLQGVDSVRVNSGWIDAGQSVLGEWSRHRTTFHASAFAIFAIAAFCVAMLAARSMDSMRDGSQVTMRALAIVGAVIGVASIGLVIVFFGVLCFAFQAFGLEWMAIRILDAAMGNLTIAATLSAVSVAVPVIGTCAGARGR